MKQQVFNNKINLNGKPVELSIKNTEISSQAHLMHAEGAEDFKMTVKDIQHLLEKENWLATDINIFFDDMQMLWRWNCTISKLRTEDQEQKEPVNIELPYVLAYSKLLCQLTKIPSSIFVEYGVEIPELEQAPEPKSEGIKTVKQLQDEYAVSKGHKDWEELREANSCRDWHIEYFAEQYASQFRK